MHKHPEQTLQRLHRFQEWILRPLLWAEQTPMSAAVYRPQEGDTPAQAATFPYEPVTPGFTWGPVWSDAWFRLEANIPEDWTGKPVCALIDVGAEAVVWDGDNPIQGIDGPHYWMRVSEDAEPGQSVVLYLRANGMNPNVSVSTRPVDPAPEPFTFRRAALALEDRELQAFALDFRMLFLLMRELADTDQPRKGQILYALNEAVNRFDESDRSTWPWAAAALSDVLRCPADPSAHRISAIGHAHIDTAWLWPLERTQHKCIHTFATATTYMDDYPEYKFVCSQAQQYKWIKQLAPRLYERIKEKHRAGQWEIAGSMWVEADCNITGGESLVRQILLAKRFWLQEFGYETVDLWLPDVFGYAASLPQILKKSGVQYFLTQKISWNQVNKFPHHTFLWKGIDGTSVFTHFPPSDTYNGNMEPRELLYSVRNFRENDRATMSLYPFGFGDGGGGPVVEHIELARRAADLEGLPRVQIQGVRDFFEAAVKDARDLPEWVGELYLEMHRGTLTSQAANKKGNRKSEFLLRDAEFLASIACEDMSEYPQQTLNDAWETVLCHQFHDIIPGSSVREVYEDSAVHYAEVANTGHAVIDDALASLASRIDTSEFSRPALVVRHRDGYLNGDLITLPLPEGARFAAMSSPGAEVSVPVQMTVDLETGLPCAIMPMPEEMPEHGYMLVELETQAAAPDDDGETGNEPELTVNNRLLDNGILRVEFDADGLITRLFDHEIGRDVLEPGCKGNQLQLFRDMPANWDAWDVDIYDRERIDIVTDLLRVDVVERGPVRIALRFEWKVGAASRLAQIVRLAANSRRLEFVTDVDWHESHRMLKAAFPVAINATRATYEIQYGNVERPTHYNTSWDLARFEVAAQKWADLSEGGYGVALLNDCKYGYDIAGNVMRLSLLRSPKAPDPECDMGVHRFTYALLPHPGDYREGAVVEHAYALNLPTKALLIEGGNAGDWPDIMSCFEVDREGVIIEAIKKAEDEDAWIVRLYDAYNSRGRVRLTTELDVQSACLCDLLERDEQPLVIDREEDGVASVEFAIGPFEIITLKLRR